ncbi:MAG: phosphatase PAP2 family protein [Acidimicrobiales bacterium]
MVGAGAREGTTWFGKAGDVTKRTLLWPVFGGALALTGARGRRAALRGVLSYGAGGMAHLLVKSVVHRARPPGATKHARFGPVTSSFPSGHCASELGFSIGVAEEIPWLFFPLYAATFAAEWSMVRSRAHYPSDVFAGAAISMILALAARKIWPPQRLAAKRPQPRAANLAPISAPGPAFLVERSADQNPSVG